MGYALQLAVKKGYRVVIISGGNSLSVKERLQNLGIIDVFIKVENKLQVLTEYVKINNLGWPELLFMGDDIPDYNCMLKAGVSCCPADAAAEIRNISNYTSPLGGGNGCVREVIEKILKLNGHWDADKNSVTVDRLP